MTVRRQAVVVIHGIGEQLPMDTLRDFADTVLEGEEYYNKPDRFSDGTDQRRLMALSTRFRPRTDFFEFYWADKFDAGRALAVWFWFLGHVVAFRRRHSGSMRLLIAYGRVAFLVGLVIVLATLGAGIGWAVSGTWGGVWSTVTVIGLIAVALTIVLAGLTNGFVATFIADASRYLAPRPADIGRRNAVRIAGVALLRRIHQSGDYDRVIFVCHSLGSVIGYDILRLYWGEASEPDPTNTEPQPKLEAFDAHAAEILAQGPTRKAMEEYQAAQTEVWKEFRKTGIPWLVSDFVTLGSPLTHAPSLWARQREEFDRKIREREFPTCPPMVAPDDDAARTPRSSFRNSDGRREPHSAALFAATRWTNLYFPMTRLLGGDLVGGPVAPVFGPGVKDVPVALSMPAPVARRVRAVPVLSHLKYWAHATGYRPKDPALDDPAPDAPRDAIRALRSAIRL